MDTAALRVFVYERLLEHGEMPAAASVARRFDVTVDAARAALRAANIGKAILPHPDTGELWMAGPFAAAPTPYRVRAGGHAWWANCAWDMLGVAALVARPGRPADLEASCGDCGAPMPMRVADVAAGVEGAGDALVHFLVPARRWYDDIGFT